MKLIKLTNIDWDYYDDEDIDSLPKELIVNVSDDQYADIEEDSTILAEMLSDYYNYCHFGFNYEDYEGENILPDVDFSEVY